MTKGKAEAFPFCVIDASSRPFGLVMRSYGVPHGDYLHLDRDDLSYDVNSVTGPP
jgi:hypothetical protein